MKRLGLVAILSVLLMLTGCIQSEKVTETKTPENLVTATVIIDFGNGTSMKFPNITSANATVYGFLLEAAKIGGFEVNATYYEQYDSIFINSIAGVENGKDNKWWQYYINGEYGQVGADKQIVKNNDTIEWKFEESKL